LLNRGEPYLLWRVLAATKSSTVQIQRTDCPIVIREELFNRSVPKESFVTSQYWFYRTCDSPTI
jgi:hypothetical protein